MSDVKRALEEKQVITESGIVQEDAGSPAERAELVPLRPSWLKENIQTENVCRKISFLKELNCGH